MSSTLLHLRVLPTDAQDRAASRRDFVAVVHPDDARSLAVRRRAVLEHASGLSVDPLRVRCRLVMSRRVEPGTVHADETLRCAINATVDDSIGVRGLHLPWRFVVYDAFAWFFGRRDSVLRVTTALASDMEKRVVRCDGDVFRLLGCEAGDYVVVHGVAAEANGKLVERRLRRRAVPVSTTAVAARVAQEHHDLGPDADPRFLSPDAIVPTGETAEGRRLDRLFVDAEGRSALATLPLGPVTCRRDTARLLGREFLDAGVFIAVGVLALGQLLPSAVLQKWWPAVIVGSVVVSFLLLCLRTRSTA